MSNASGGERIVFRDRVSELQDKLRKSEEERLRLEAQFEVMMIAAREEEAARLSMLRGKYEKIVECEKRRRDRNDQILHTLDRIESRTAMIVAKSERLQLLRRHYEAYVASIYPAWNGNAISSGYNGFTVPQIQPVPQHHPPRNGARSPTLQNDPLLFPLNPVKGAYISPYPSQKPYDLIPSSLNQILQTPVFEKQTPARTQEDIVPPPQFSHQSIPSINQPLHSLPQLNQNAPYQPQSIIPKQNLLYPSPVTPKTNIPRSYDNVDKTSNEYRRRNLFPDEPYTYEEISAKPKENGISKYLSGLGTDDVPRNDTNLELNDYMKKTADLLNYTMRDYGKEATTTPNEEESKLANSTDFELEQNTSGDILNVTLSDDGILNEDEPISKTQTRKQDILYAADDYDDGYKSRKVVQFNEKQELAKRANTLGENDNRAYKEAANVKHGEFGQGDGPQESIAREKRALQEGDQRYAHLAESQAEFIPENDDEQEKFSEIQGENQKLVDNQDVGSIDEAEERLNLQVHQEILEVNPGMGREDVNGHKRGQQKEQVDDNFELHNSQYIEDHIANGDYEQEQAGVHQYENGEDQRYDSEQLQEHGEYVEADESTDYYPEPQYASDQHNADQTYAATEDQGEYVVQDQTEYVQDQPEYDQDQQEYVQNQPEYVQNQPEYVQDQQEYVQDQGEYVQDQQEYVQDQPEYVQDHPEYVQDQPEYVQDQLEYVQEQPEYVQDQQEYVQEQPEYVQGEEGYVTQDQYGEQQLGDEYQGQYEMGHEDLVPQEERQYDGDEYQQQYQEQDGQYEVDHTQYQPDDQTHYANDTQGQYVEGQALYEEEQPQYDEDQSQYAEGQNLYEGGQNQYAEQQEQYAEYQKQYGTQDQGRYAPEDQEVQGQYSTENQDQYQVGTDEAAYQEYLLQHSQEYADSNYEVDNGGGQGENQQWQGGDGSEVYFEEGKYHEPTAGYEREKTGGEHLPTDEDGDEGHEMPETLRKQVYYEESHEYQTQKQGGNNIHQARESVEDANQYTNDDTSTSSAVEVEEKVGAIQGAAKTATKPRKTGLAMLESDTESPVHVGNTVISNDDSDFDFSSGK